MKKQSRCSWQSSKLVFQHNENLGNQIEGEKSEITKKAELIIRQLKKLPDITDLPFNANESTLTKRLNEDQLQILMDIPDFDYEVESEISRILDEEEKKGMSMFKKGLHSFKKLFSTSNIDAIVDIIRTSSPGIVGRPKGPFYGIVSFNKYDKEDLRFWYGLNEAEKDNFDNEQTLNKIFNLITLDFINDRDSNFPAKVRYLVFSDMPNDRMEHQLHTRLKKVLKLNSVSNYHSAKKLLHYYNGPMNLAKNDSDFDITAMFTSKVRNQLMYDN